ncbi:hypothetical protein LX97_00111 [Nonlabens dokdonensis]|jgi:hypothetical protein|uniref:TonB-dependent receptor plug domain-containing protein n=2 Tax=Nonlabens dokdonensis TaxID=328515 RepID=L7W976_NONDD|nr:hypothetical protein [Nonlabens dokdonensis]AGC75413.1 hypothetical protein DDD_0286 [Nonlabens dokdonensis DSW-6]PZX43112.1 hypothetical protein LX97_00111 [Nonlabens dokdonensis]
MKLLHSFLLCFLLLCCWSLSAQNENDDVLSKTYTTFNNIPQEVAYLHLNKSTYIKGEQIAFTAYVLDKLSKNPSAISSNLYVTLENKSGDVLSQQLLGLRNGTASNVIELDSTFTSGSYVIKAYTNWMRNFDAQNHYSEHIRIIDPKLEKVIREEITATDLDIQFLPEGGKFVDEVVNAVGIIAKDNTGHGIGNLKGKIYDRENNFISNFSTNQVGIGRFYLKPSISTNYYATYSYKDEDYKVPLEITIEPLGTVLSCATDSKNLFVNVLLNEATNKQVKNKKYQIAVHNDRGILLSDVIFRKEGKQLFSFDLSTLPSGINVVTLFDDLKEPISERIIFNSVGFEKHAFDDVAVSQTADSIQISFKGKSSKASSLGSISASILPVQTLSYNKHQSIVSQNYLQSYLKGSIENASYYFTDVDGKKRYDLDNLMLTQGWRSYNWFNKFKIKESYHLAENGLTVKATLKSDKNKRLDGFYVDLPNEQSHLILDYDDTKDSFWLENVYVEDQDSLFITDILKNQKFRKPKLNIESYPSEFPVFNTETVALNTKFEEIPQVEAYDFILNQPIEGVQNLDEIVIVTEREEALTRAEELSKGRFGEVKVLTSSDRKMYFMLEDYIRAQSGIRVEGNRDLTFKSRTRDVMAIFIDDAFFGYSIPSRFIFMSEVDYVEINQTGLGTQPGSAFRTSGGAIRIYTGPFRIDDGSKDKKVGVSYTPPLRFTSQKSFYTPKYANYNSDFYLKYGTLDWKAQVTPDDQGNYTIKIKKPLTPFTIYLEGVLNNNQLLSQQITIDSKNLGVSQYP